KRPGAPTGGTVKFVDIWSVLIGDVNMTPVIGNAQAFGVVPGIVGIAGVVCGIEVVGAPGEVKPGSGVDRRRAIGDGIEGEVDALAYSGSVNERILAVKQRRLGQGGRENKRQAGARRVAHEFHGEGVEAVDVTDGAVDFSVRGGGRRGVDRGVWPAV